MDVNTTQDSGVSAFLSGWAGNAERLYDLARSRTQEDRAKLTHEISSIFEINVQPRESEIIADVLITLLRQAERDLRQTISEKLCTLDNVPLRLILQLANDKIEIARPVLRYSAVLGDHDLMYIIKSKSPEYWRTIATRQVLSAQVIDLLADTKDFDTALALAQNAEIILTPHSVTALSDIARESDVLALPLLRRAEVPDDLAVALYRYVGVEIKQFIKENYELDIQSVIDVTQAVDRSVGELAAVTNANGDEHSHAYKPETYMIEAAKAAKKKDMLSVQGMLGTLRRDNLSSFVAQLSVYTDMPCMLVEQILYQKSGQGLALIAKAFHIEKQDFIAMFMLARRFRGEDAPSVDPADIKSAIKYYDKATPDLAARIIKEKGAGFRAGDR